MSFYFLSALCTYWFCLGFQVGRREPCDVLVLIALGVFWPLTWGAIVYRNIRGESAS